VNGVDREKIKCVNCQRWLFLALGDLHVEIKCKCGTIQTIKRSANAAAAAVVHTVPAQH
jgi:phage FluMu protein Com